MSPSFPVGGSGQGTDRFHQEHAAQLSFRGNGGAVTPSMPIQN